MWTDSLSRQVEKDIERSSLQKDLLDYKQKVIQEMEEHNRKKMEKVLDFINSIIESKRGS